MEGSTKSTKQVITNSYLNTDTSTYTHTNKQKVNERCRDQEN